LHSQWWFPSWGITIGKTWNQIGYQGTRLVMNNHCKNSETKRLSKTRSNGDLHWSPMGCNSQCDFWLTPSYFAIYESIVKSCRQLFWPLCTQLKHILKIDVCEGLRINVGLVLGMCPISTLNIGSKEPLVLGGCKKWSENWLGL